MRLQYVLVDVFTEQPFQGNPLQGVEMGRPSRLWARLGRDADGELRPRVAGGVVRVGEGAFDL